ncbi:MAG: DUF4926 domain-containing protein [Chitinophagaceae bacterium]|nr:MAG: DUF4926 domain-containing protein [Chitinophagaceae bacterium]
MIKELDTVVLTFDFPDYQLVKGDVGTVVFIYENGKAYEVEFTSTDGSTIALLKLNPPQIRPSHGKKEIIHIRKIA